MAAVTRRGFIKGAAGITFVIGASGLVAACEVAEEVAEATGIVPNIWLRIASNGVITILAPAAEMGQGSMTALPLILTEELDADWGHVKVEQISRAKKEYGNPRFGNLMYTGGSMAVSGYYTILRTAGAQARRILINAAAARWDVPAAELSTEPSVVVHKASGKRLSYGDIAAFAEIPETLPEITDADLKAPADFRYIGHDMPRVDVPLKVRGEAQYAMDVRVPGMVYAAILHAPVEGETPVSIDDAATREVAGVVDVVTLDNAVAVIGDTVEATRFGKDALSVEWTTNLPARKHGTESDLAAYSKAANNLELKGTPWRAEGDFDAAFAAADKKLTAEYHCDYVYHAQMEPLNATALVNEAGDGVEIWAGTQTQTLTTMAAAKALGTTPDKIELHEMFLGGGYGRRAELEPTYLLEAIELSKRLKKPVKVIWSREDDIENGWFRPLVAQVMRAGLDGDGNVVAWNHRLAGPSVLEFYNSVRWSMQNGRDVISMLGSELADYGVPNILAEHVMMDRRARLSPWRGVATGSTMFAVESFIDEIAHEQGEDPVEFRLKRLLKSDRSRHVLETVAEMAGWGKPRPEGRALGVAFAGYHASLAAGIVEISVNEKTGRIKVHKFWAVADPGTVVQPLNAQTQLEGAIIYGLSHALTERITIENGQVQQSNYHDYHVMRMAELPEIETRVLSTGNAPSGMGELGLPMTGGAIANALFTLTGKRLRRLPLTADRVLEAMKA